MVNETDIRMFPYILARILHAAISGLVAYFLLPSLISTVYFSVQYRLPCRR